MDAGFADDLLVAGHVAPDEFRELGYPLAGALKVIVQDGAGGADTGLVGFRLANAATFVSIEPAAGADAASWVATMEPRETEEVLDSAGLLSLSGELATLSALCTFLQAKSQSYLGSRSA